MEIKFKKILRKKLNDGPLSNGGQSKVIGIFFFFVFAYNYFNFFFSFTFWMFSGKVWLQKTKKKLKLAKKLEKIQQTLDLTSGVTKTFRGFSQSYLMENVTFQGLLLAFCDGENNLLKSIVRVTVAAITGLSSTF